MNRLASWISAARVLAAALAVLAASSVGAQEAAVQEGDSGEVAIQRAWFGVGNVCRPGEWTGIQLRINDSNDKPREVLIRIPTQDSDGDKTLWEATLTTNPGVNQPVWVYLRLPAGFKSSTPLRAQVFEAVEAGNAAPGQSIPVSAGRQLGSVFITPQQVLSTGEGMLGIVGNRTMGLRKYAGIPNHAYLPAGHERNEIVDRLDPETLPDRWQGLMQFAAIAWNEPAPGSLTSEKSQAIREWVQRGGHLIVVLPRVAQTWTDEANNPLFDIVPKVRINRIEGVNLEPLRSLITPLAQVATEPRDRLDMPTNEVLQTMTPIEGASQHEAAGIIAMPAPADGSEPEWLVARRQVGLGMVTLVGLDCASRWMELRSLPDPELFWHRILGRRGQMVPERDPSDPGGVFNRNRNPTTVDNNIAAEIAKTTLAGAGVLLGLVVFVLYWLVAGPLGYAALKRTGRQRHAWVAFVAAAALFTGIAWGGASMIRPVRISAAHVTILDHVYTPEGSSLQRARAWMSVLIPQYGDATVALGDPTKPASERYHNLITPWEHEKQSSAGFPDARGYRVNSRDPDHYSIPTRSTVKTFQVDWAGGPVWKMPRPVPDASGKTSTLSATLTERERGEKGVSLTGSLVHELPEALRDVVIVVNLGQRDLSRTGFSGPLGAWRLTADLFAATLPQPWEPGEPVNLASIQRSFGRGDSIVQGNQGKGFFDSLLDSAANDPDGMDAPGKSLTKMGTKMRALTFLGMIEPPAQDDERRRNYAGVPVIRRQTTHGWDLSQWMTQPCIIIMGHLGGDEGQSPVPLTVSTGGAFRPVPTAGTTFVRWVYPLTPRPPAYRSSGNQEPTPESPSPPT